jgi:cobalt-precorrin-5B (C1)-methyltransferase
MDQPALRYGWTTGACAAAATRAAMLGLFEGAIPAEVTITLPKGETPTFPVLDPAMGEGWASAFVEKDAGDDPDVTHGALIGVRVARSAGEGVRFIAGEGVGTVTKPGLPIGVGEPAINPVPRAMVLQEISRVLLGKDEGFPSGNDGFAIEVTVSVPGGVELAAKRRKRWSKQASRFASSPASAQASAG